MIATDLDGIVTLWNAAAERTFGWSAGEALGQPITELTVPHGASQEQATEIMATLQAGESWSGEFLLRRRDGSIFPALVTDSGAYDDTGLLVGIVGVSADLTAQRAAQQEIVANEERLRTVLQHSPLVVFSLDVEGVITFAQGSVLESFGVTPQELAGVPISSFCHVVPDIVDAAQRSLQGESAETLLTVADRHYDVRFVPRRDWEGRVSGALGVATDVTERVRAVERVAASEQRWRSLVSRSADVAVIADREGSLSYVSLAAARLFGWAPEELVGTCGFALAHPADRDMVEAAVGRCLNDPDVHPVIEFRLRTKDGSWRWVEETISNMFDDPQISGLVGNLRDVTDRHVAGEALRTSEARYRAIVETAQEAICLLDAAGNVLVANARLAELAGKPLSRIVGAPGAQLINGLDAALAATARRRRRVRHRDVYELRHTPPSGSPVSLIAAASPLYDADGQSNGTLVMLTDVTQRKQAEAQLAHLALHDPLTGLPNRALLADRISGAIDRRTTHRGEVGVLFIDIDQFKTINDSLGHAAGDTVLGLIAGRLKDAVRDEDTVGRLGGDEFVILAENLTSSDTVTALADRVMDALTAPVRVAGLDVVVSVSIGVTLTTADEPATTEQLLHQADVAMYRAKGRGRACWDSHDSTTGGPISDQLHVIGELRAALAGGELRLHYQPQVRLDTNEVVGVEALLRWQHPKRGLLAPAAFLAAAEGSGMIRDIGVWVLRTACRQAAAWHAAAPDTAPLTVSVNLSAHQLDDPALTAKVTDILLETGLDPATLVLEMTETAVMTDAGTVLATLTQLKALGVGLAIDDFGTGYSSMIYLKRFPVDELKIDRSFINGLGEDSEDTAIVTFVVRLAAALGIRAVAEGVESEQQRISLKALGCELGQGYLWSPARPASELLPWIPTEIALAV